MDHEKRCNVQCTMYNVCVCISPYGSVDLSRGLEDSRSDQLAPPLVPVPILIGIVGSVGRSGRWREILVG